METTTRTASNHELFKFHSCSNFANVWFGLRKQDESSPWLWTDGGNRSFWPHDMLFDKPETEFCAKLIPRLEDDDCSEKRWYLCKFPLPPTGKHLALIFDSDSTVISLYKF